MSEIWKPVSSYEGLYEVSNEGRVRSLPRIDTRGCRRKGKLLKQCSINAGHRYVSLSKGSQVEKVLIHRMVLFAFSSPCPEGFEARHIDGNPRNNDIQNLRWADRSCNTHDRYKHGVSVRKKVRRGDGVVYKGLLFAAKAMGCSKSNIWCAIKGISKTAVGHTWEYV